MHNTPSQILQSQYIMELPSKGMKQYYETMKQQSRLLMKIRTVRHLECTERVSMDVAFDYFSSSPMENQSQSCSHQLLSAFQLLCHIYLDQEIFQLSHKVCTSL